MNTQHRTLAPRFVPLANFARQALFLSLCIALVSLGACSGGGDDGGNAGGGSGSQMTQEWQAELATESIADWVVDSVTSQLEQGSHDKKVVPSATGSATVTGTLSSSKGGTSNHVWTKRNNEIIITFDNYTATRPASRFSPDKVTITGTVYFHDYGRSDQYGSGRYTSSWTVNVAGQGVVVHVSDDTDKDVTFSGAGDFSATGKFADNLSGRWKGPGLTLEF